MERRARTLAQAVSGSVGSQAVSVGASGCSGRMSNGTNETGNGSGGDRSCHRGRCALWLRPPRALPASPADVQPQPVETSPAIGADLQPRSPDVRPSPVAPVDIQPRPVTAADPLPPRADPPLEISAPHPPPTAEQDKDVFSALKRIPDLLRPDPPAPTGETPRPPMPVGTASPEIREFGN